MAQVSWDVTLYHWASCYRFAFSFRAEQSKKNILLHPDNKDTTTFRIFRRNSPYILEDSQLQDPATSVVRMQKLGNSFPFNSLNNNHSKKLRIKTANNF